MLKRIENLEEKRRFEEISQNSVEWVTFITENHLHFVLVVSTP